MSATEAQASKTVHATSVSGAPAFGRGLARNFRLLWLGEGVSAFGNQFTLVALPELALALSGSWSVFGAVMIVWSLSQAGFLLLGGALADRLGPRRLMMAANLVGATVLAAYCVLVESGAAALWQLFAGALALGAASAAFLPSVLALLPLVVDRDSLIRGNAVLQGTAQIMTFVGPGPAGLLIATFGLGAAFGVDALTFVFAFLVLGLIRGIGAGRAEGAAQDAAARGASGGHEPTRESLVASLGAGIAYARRDALILPYLSLIAVSNLGWFGPYRVGVPSFAHDVLQGGSTALGTLFSALGGGLILGAVIGSSIPRVRRLGLLLVTMTLTMASGFWLLSDAGTLLAGVLAIALIGCSSGVINVRLVSWLQARADPVFRGRVMGLVMFSSVGMAPLSYAAAGLLVNTSHTVLFTSAAALVALASLLALLHPAFRADSRATA